MQKNTDRTAKKIAPIVWAAVFIVLLGLYLLLIVSASLGETMQNGVLFLFIAAIVMVIGAVIVGICLALRQRLREIDSGEEEEARKY